MEKLKGNERGREDRNERNGAKEGRGDKREKEMEYTKE